MLLKHFFIEKIAHSSYILAGKETCAVIDPQRDVDLYLQEARSLWVSITHIFHTHLHADFVSGHMDLQAKTGAKIYAPASANCDFDHVALAEGDVIKLENMDLAVLETPGHTPEHVSYVVTDHSRGDDPIGVFVGDTLFVGDVGRPDLFPDMAKELAGKLYHSLHDKLMKLPDYVEVYPAHGAGSLCGRSMGAKWLSTIGYERLYNPALQIEDKDEFIDSLTNDMPPAPDHFSRCSEINRQGPKKVDDLPVLKEITIEDFTVMMENPDVAILDIRPYASFASLHIPGAWHIDLNGNFPTFTGWVLPIDKDILMVADNHEDVLLANLWMRRVGMDRAVGYLQGSMVAWVTKGKKIDDILMISAEDLHERMMGEHDFVLVDVRAPLEFADSHISGAINIPAPDLRERYKELDPEQPTVLVCSSGNRSSLAGSILKQHGFKHVYNLAGGMTGYSAAGFAKECKVCVNPHGSRYTAGTYQSTI
jgi:glyoxylase-like metal-dependent hydrolase (beta-lactamase superfamily II)/rhodanese-related sulfurtransferase